MILTGKLTWRNPACFEVGFDIPATEEHPQGEIVLGCSWPLIEQADWWAFRGGQEVEIEVRTVERDG